jgi:hypothetical protein
LKSLTRQKEKTARRGGAPGRSFGGVLFFLF